MLTMIDYAKQRAAQAKDLSIKIASEHEAALGSYSPGHWSGLTGTKCPLQADYLLGSTIPPPAAAPPPP
jgi:hypothetical protein